jgi:hypothetical protein
VVSRSDADAVLEDVLDALGLGDDAAVTLAMAERARKIIAAALDAAGEEAIEADHDRRADERAWRSDVRAGL